jgi:hypothetical protein
MARSAAQGPDQLQKQAATRVCGDKTRYYGGKLAVPMLFLRRWLSDRAFDRLLMLAFR